MGVPKFYRWISERYPCLSTVAREYQLPDFDNLYLDMNGIIHVCSHPNDTDAHFRITEEEIFVNIFEYIDFIFRMVKPRKMFFMAVDGVAPRAKMNQQRDRRFRSAKDAQEVEKEAKNKGEELPTEKRFDSNCISPGTEFMERLHEQLKYFVVRKLSQDPVWQKEGLKVFLSGHNVPGEGEHKAMDFIRYLRSQEGYDPNTRHCIYGQDADLIMLALCTHEPHIALLREEVVFGKKTEKRVQSADKVTFHLLHINLLREYLNHEFSGLKGLIKFEYNIESIIDDWLLMCFLVGNDFIPHLPNLHIAHDALPILYRTYMDVMPQLDGYLHTNGKLSLKNFEVYMKKLGERDIEMFQDIKDDSRWLKGKMAKRMGKEVVQGLEERERKRQEEYRKDLELARMKFSELDIPSSSDEDESTDTSNEEFRQHKRNYYMDKMDYDEVDEKVLREQAEGYVRAIQWNLHYYYNGVQSWSWYYPHHYSPFISDIKGFADLNIDFEVGKPFLPFQQLVSIMPAASKELIPAAYRGLMLREDSPLKIYFPDDFETDLNGKTQAWEAVVLIKYIEEEILLSSMKQFDSLLTDYEKSRNQHGAHLCYEYYQKSLGKYSSPLPGHKSFPSIAHNRAHCTEIEKDTFRIATHTIKKGRLANTKDSLYFPGFPSLSRLKHTAILCKGGVTVFQQPSRGDNMMIDITSKADVIPVIGAYSTLLNQIVHIEYPHLRQAKIVKVTDGKKILTINGITDCSEIETLEFTRRKDEQERRLRVRWGIETGGKELPKLLVYCTPMVGRKYIYQGDNQVTISTEWSDQESYVLHNTIVCNLEEHVEVATHKTVQEVFPVGKNVFLLDRQNYGMYGSVETHGENGDMIVHCKFREEPNFSNIRQKESSLRKNNYLPAYRVAQELKIESHLVARLTGCIQVQINSREADSAVTLNVGLNLKFNKKNEEVPGFSKKLKTHDGRTEWRFSKAASDALLELITNFQDFFIRLKGCMGMDKIPLEEVYPGEQFLEGVTVAKAVAAWIKEQPFTKAPHQKSGGIAFDEGVVQAIEAEVDKTQATREDEVMVKVHAKTAYMPGMHVGLFAPDPKATFRLYDRVVNVRQDITIPLGLKGTVIAIQKPDEEGADSREATYDILFDGKFPTGGTLRGASGPRVATLSMVSMINISHGRRNPEDISQDRLEAVQEELEMQELVRRGHGAWQSDNQKCSRILARDAVPDGSHPKGKHQSDPQRIEENGKAEINKRKSGQEEPRDWYPESNEWLNQVAKKGTQASANGRTLSPERVRGNALKDIDGVTARRGQNIVNSHHMGIPLSVEDLIRSGRPQQRHLHPARDNRVGVRPRHPPPQRMNQEYGWVPPAYNNVPPPAMYHHQAQGCRDEVPEFPPSYGASFRPPPDQARMQQPFIPISVNDLFARPPPVQQSPFIPAKVEANQASSKSTAAFHPQMIPAKVLAQQRRHQRNTTDSEQDREPRSNPPERNPVPQSPKKNQPKQQQNADQQQQRQRATSPQHQQRPASHQHHTQQQRHTHESQQSHSRQEQDKRREGAEHGRRNGAELGRTEGAEQKRTGADHGSKSSGRRGRLGANFNSRQQQ